MVFIDWTQPPKSIDDFASGKYHENWRPRIAQTLNFDRPKWKRQRANHGVSYNYDGRAEVDLDCDSNMASRHHRLKHRVIIIRYIRVFPEHRRQGVMTEILTELVDQFPNADLLAVLSPQECDKHKGAAFMKKVYERLDFIEIDWQDYLTFSEHYDFHQRCSKDGFFPPAMVHVGGGDDEARKLWGRIEKENVDIGKDNLNKPIPSRETHPKLRAEPHEMSLRLKNTARYY